MKHPESLDDIKARAELRMAAFDTLPIALRPIVRAVNDVPIAVRLYNAGARTFEETEAIVPMLRMRC
jgi:hypothetical protein